MIKTNFQSFPAISVTQCVSCLVSQSFTHLLFFQVFGQFEDGKAWVWVFFDTKNEFSVISSTVSTRLLAIGLVHSLS